MRAFVAAAPVLLLLLAGCSGVPADAEPDAAGDLPLLVSVRNDGTLPVEYRIEARAYQDGVPAEAQGGPVRQVRQAQVQPDAEDRTWLLLPRVENHWIEIRVGAVPRPVLGGGGFSFQVEPGACPTAALLADGQARHEAMQFGGSWSLHCGDTVLVA